MPTNLPPHDAPVTADNLRAAGFMRDTYPYDTAVLSISNGCSVLCYRTARRRFHLENRQGARVFEFPIQDKPANMWAVYAMTRLVLGRDLEKEQQR